MRCKTLFLICVILIFTGCGKTPLPEVEKQIIPQWVDTITPNDSFYLYGVGVATDRQSAAEVALANLVAQLSTTLESKMEVSQESEGSYYYKSQAKNIISSHVRPIEIKNYDVIKAHRINFEKFAVMLRVDKAKLATNLIRSLEDKIKKYQQELEVISKAHVVEQFNKKKEISKSSDRLLSDIEVIELLDNRHVTKEYRDFIANVRTEFLKIKNTLHFVVRSKNLKASAFADKIKNYLSGHGFRVITHPTQNTIMITVSLEDSIVKDSYVNIVLLKIKVDTSCQSHNIATNTITIKERLIGSLQNTYENGAKHLQNDMDSLGLREVLGFHINID